MLLRVALGDLGGAERREGLERVELRGVGRERDGKEIISMPAHLSPQPPPHLRRLAAARLSAQQDHVRCIHCLHDLLLHACKRDQAKVNAS